MRVEDGEVRGTMAQFEALAAGEGRETVAQVPGMVEALAAVDAPLVRLQLSTATRTSSRMTFGWIGEAAVAVLMQVAREWQLLAVPLDQLPIVLARLTSLHPVTPPQRAARTDAELEPFFADDAAVRVPAFDACDAALAFTLGATDGDEEWRMAGLTGPSGSWLLESAADEWILRPVPARVVYRRFTAILPGLVGPRLGAPHAG
jgi:hypothetical protein